ncbi:unnamed protein product, partial [Closterium sp. NIES-64]
MPLTLLARSRMDAELPARDAEAEGGETGETGEAEALLARRRGGEEAAGAAELRGPPPGGAASPADETTAALCSAVVGSEGSVEQGKLGERVVKEGSGVGEWDDGGGRTRDGGGNAVEEGGREEKEEEDESTQQCRICLEADGMVAAHAHTWRGVKMGREVRKHPASAVGLSASCTAPALTLGGLPRCTAVGRGSSGVCGLVGYRPLSIVTHAVPVPLAACPPAVIPPSFPPYPTCSPSLPHVLSLLPLPRHSAPSLHQRFLSPLLPLPSFSPAMHLLPSPRPPRSLSTSAPSPITAGFCILTPVPLPSPQGSAFSRCSECRAPFSLRPHLPRDRSWHRLRFRAVLLRDHAALVTLVLLLVGALGVFTYRVFGRQLRDALGFQDRPHEFFSFAASLLALLGIVYSALMAVLCSDCITERHAHVLHRGQLTK